jgi:E3 ubiquitin-protein ligase TRIP12
LENLEEYIQLVTHMTLVSSSQSQSGPAEAFKEGLSKLVNVERLRMFSGEELEYLICGAGSESWSQQTLLSAVVPAHGFSKQSHTYKNLLAVMEQLSTRERRLFLQFATGSPRLPVGGFEALSPPLTVVKKGVPAGCDMDSYLPSVMT